VRVLAYFRSRAALRREVHAAAQLDLRDGLLEARDARIAELEALNARLAAELATYKAPEFMRTALRLRRRLGEEKTAERPAPGYPARHVRDEVPTEFHPRAVQRRDPSSQGDRR